MSQPDPASSDQHEEVSLAAADVQYQRIMEASGKLQENYIAWLFDVGNWIFGGLIAFNLLVMVSLITVGPVDISIKLSTALLALALPLNVTGLVLLKLVQGLKPVGFEEVTQAFQEVGLTLSEQQTGSRTRLEARRTRITRNVLGTTLGILALSGALTLSGMTAALWHMGWWIGVAFVAMVLISLVVILVVQVTSQPRASAEEKAQRKRYREEVIRQAQERSRQAEKQKEKPGIV
jgi:uncharacterized membrane protein